MTKTPILIAGPTASGKSQLALDLANRLGGAIINTDSMQVYKDLRVLTARPSEEEEAQAPHFLYGVIDASVRCSAGVWGRMAAETLIEVERAGLRPIFVGGTGLYFAALTQGLSAIPEIPSYIRAQAARRIDAGEIDDLFQDLVRRDPESAARMGPTDTQRIQRAWEVLQATDKGLSEWNREKQEPVLKEPPIRIVLEPVRNRLYARCEKRFEIMLSEGALDEVRLLLKRGLSPTLPALKALGVRELGDYLSGHIQLGQAIGRSKMMTRRYAKRQLTWMRNQMEDWDRLDPASKTLFDDAMSVIDAGPH